MAIFGAIAGILGSLTGIGRTISSISGDIANAKIAALEAGTDQERIAAEERARALEARRDVMIAEAASGNRINTFMRAALTFPVVVLLAKILIWDKALGELTGGTTDPLSPELWQVVMVVIGFYFLYETARAVVRR